MPGGRREGAPDEAVMSPAVGLVAAAWCVVVGVGLIFGDSPCGRKGGRPGKGRGGTARPENERPLLDALSTLWSVTKGIVFTLVSLAALPVTVGLPVALSCGCALLPPDFTLRLPCSARRYRPRRWVDRLRLFAYIEFCAPRFPARTPSAAACDPMPLQPSSPPRADCYIVPAMYAMPWLYLPWRAALGCTLALLLCCALPMRGEFDGSSEWPAFRHGWLMRSLSSGDAHPWRHVEQAPLDPERQYLFAGSPHGTLPVGWGLMFAGHQQRRFCPFAPCETCG